MTENKLNKATAEYLLMQLELAAREISALQLAEIKRLVDAGDDERLDRFADSSRRSADSFGAVRALIASIGAIDPYSGPALADRYLESCKPAPKFNLTAFPDEVAERIDYAIANKTKSLIVVRNRFQLKDLIEYTTDALSDGGYGFGAGGQDITFGPLGGSQHNYIRFVVVTGSNDDSYRILAGLKFDFVHIVDVKGLSEHQTKWLGGLVRPLDGGGK